MPNSARLLPHWQQTLTSVQQRLNEQPRWFMCGRLVRATGMVLEAVGLRVPVGSHCCIEANANSITAEVVGFAGDIIYLMPLNNVQGLVPGARVVPFTDNDQSGQRFPLGPALLG